MKNIFHILIFLFVGGCSFSGKSERIAENLKVQGKPYFEHLVTTQQYESLLNKIENGDEVLIKSSSLLSKWVDASASLSLKYSLSRAIIIKPDSVMQLIPEFFSVSDICTIPYIEAPIEVDLNHVQESLSALESSINPRDVHIECINTYKKIRENITKSSSGR